MCTYPGIGACLPATAIGTPNEGVVEVRFSDGERYAANTEMYMYNLLYPIPCRQKVSKEKCFWISPAYFISAIEYISRAFPCTSN